MLLEKIDSFFYKLRLKKLLKQIKYIGENSYIHHKITMYYVDRISIGSNVYIGPNAEINGLGGVTIDDGVIIGPNLVIHSANHRFVNSKSIPYDEYFDFKKVIIEENVWIGGNVIISPGSHIGEGVIVGAGCVVSGKIPPFSIIVGNPCKVIKTRDRDHYIKLKKEGKVYMRLKKDQNLKPNIDENFI